ncbi:Uncharacterised protein [Acinetobacter baumannii]|nr:Uncharacterised protein [Acinetobacter baumannii]
MMISIVTVWFVILDTVICLDAVLVKMKNILKVFICAL